MKKLGLVAGAIVAALFPALALASRGHGLALLVYTLGMAGLVLLLLIELLNRALPRTSFSWPPRPRPR
jgi:hypothetical protein